MRNPVGIRTIAEKLGIAPCTVSSVLNGNARKRRIKDETARRILEECKRLNYVPNQLARSLRDPRTMMLGTVFADLRNDWAARILDGVRIAADRNKMLPMVMSHEWDPVRERKGIEMLLRFRIDFIITIPLPECVETYSLVRARGVPLVFLGDTLKEMPEADFVSWDHAPAVRAIMRHLVGRGAKRIATLEHNRKTQLTKAYYETYTSVLAEEGLQSDPSWRMLAAFESEVEGLLAPVFSKGVNERPDALFCTNDGLAFVAIAVLRRMGLRVPEDVMVTGMGDLGKGDENGVGLTTVREPCEDIGRLAAEVGLSRLENPQQAPTKLLLAGTEIKARLTTRR